MFEKNQNQCLGDDVKIRLLQHMCEEHDVLIFISDLIYHNIDPIVSGKEPKDFGDTTKKKNGTDWRKKLEIT